MQESEARKMIGYRVRIESDDYAYDGLEGIATGVDEGFASLIIDVAGRRWMIPLEDIGQAFALRPYRVVSGGVELPGLMAESDDAAMLQAHDRASRSPGDVLEVWAGRRLVGWATLEEIGVAS